MNLGFVPRKMAIRNGGMLLLQRLILFLFSECLQLLVLRVCICRLVLEWEKQAVSVTSKSH